MKSPAIELKIITPADLETVMPQIREMNEMKFRQFHKRMERGDSCYIGFSDSVPCHYSWVMHSGNTMNIFSAGKKFNVSDDMAWIFDCRTNDNYRGKSIYPHVINLISNNLISQGKIVFIDTTTDNKASVKGISKAGFTPYIKGVRLGICKWQKRLK